MKQELVMTTLNEVVAQERQDAVEHNMFKEKLTELLNTPMSSEMKKYYKEHGIKLQSNKLNDAMNASLVIRALEGNISAYTTIRDTMGHKPTDHIHQDTTVRIVMPDSVKELGE